MGVPDGFPVITPEVAMVVSRLRMVEYEASPEVALYAGHVRAGHGGAADGPRTPLSHVDVMLEPGAYRCVQDP